MTSTTTLCSCAAANSIGTCCWPTLRRYHLLYGTYGISLFAVRGLTIDEMAQQVPLVRFDRLTLITAWELASAGLRLEPTGRNPRHYTVGFDELERGVKAIVSCGRRVITNAYHDA
jgi:hypothetical protein